MSISGLLIIPLVAAFILLIPWPRKIMQFIFFAGGVILAVGGWVLVFHSDTQLRVFAFGQNLMLDSLSAFFVLLIVTIGFLSNVYAQDRNGQKSVSIWNKLVVGK